MGDEFPVKFLDLDTKEFTGDLYRWGPELYPDGIGARENFWYNQLPESSRQFDYFMWEHESNIVFFMQDYINQHYVTD